MYTPARLSDAYANMIPKSIDTIGPRRKGNYNWHRGEVNYQWDPKKESAILANNIDR